VLLRRGPCDGLITRPEESYRLWRVVVCGLEKTNLVNEDEGQVPLEGGGYRAKRERERERKKKVTSINLPLDISQYECHMKLTRFWFMYEIYGCKYMQVCMINPGII
jgi:hypothetical protein